MIDLRNVVHWPRNPASAIVVACRSYILHPPEHASISVWNVLSIRTCAASVLVSPGLMWFLEIKALSATGESVDGTPAAGNCVAPV